MAHLKLVNLNKEPETKFGGGKPSNQFDAIVIERVSNGYILRLVSPGPNGEEILEDVKVFNNREELLLTLSRNI